LETEHSRMNAFDFITAMLESNARQMHSPKLETARVVC
jgi:hypothetical protein